LQSAGAKAIRSRVRGEFDRQRLADNTAKACRPLPARRDPSMITMKTKYALKALSRLAVAPKGQPLLIADIAEQEGIPKKFLELILSELKQHGILTSRKGRGGGYLMARAPEEVTVASVLRVLDGPIAPVPCLSRTAYQRCSECANEATCSVRLVLREAHEASVKVLENTTIADMINRVGQERGALPALRYSI
jgi:Rrf2 family protein